MLGCVKPIPENRFTVLGNRNRPSPSLVCDICRSLLQHLRAPPPPSVRNRPQREDAPRASKFIICLEPNQTPLQNSSVAFRLGTKHNASSVWCQYCQKVLAHRIVSFATQKADILFLKKDNRILRQTSNPVCDSYKSQASSSWDKQHRA